MENEINAEVMVLEFKIVMFSFVYTWPLIEVLGQFTFRNKQKQKKPQPNPETTLKNRIL